MKMKFDERALINDLIKSLNRELDSVAEVLMQFMIGEIGMSASSSDAELAQWKLDTIQNLKWRAVASAGELVREVGILDQSDDVLYKAFAVAFGTGTKADTSDNPWYQEYLSSEFYHSSRGSMEIYSLPGEMVYDADENAWKESTATERSPLPFFAQDGTGFWTNVFGNSATLAETYFNQAIENAIGTMDFSKHLIVGS